MRTRLGALAMMVVAAVTPAAADNLLTNPQMDTGVAGWSNYGTVPAWNADDRYASPTSGSMALNVGGDIPLGAVQCVPLPMGGTYELAVDHRRESGATTSFVTVQVWWYEDADCVTFAGSNFTNGTVTTSWARTSAQWSAPANAGWAQVGVFAGTSGSAAEVHLDDAYFGEPIVFQDGFSSADGSRWTGTVP